MSPPGPASDFRELLEALASEGVRFVVVGAHAMAALGYPRATGDLDVLVRPDPENATRVHAALLRFGAPMGAHGVTAADFAIPDNVYQIGLPPFRIDLLTSISGVTFDEAWDGRFEAEFEGLRVPFLGREAFLRNKRASGRTKDLLDIELLEGSDDDTEAG